MGLTALSLEGRFLLDGPDGRRVFLKTYGASRGWRNARRMDRLQREAACLEVLSGLAVPKIVPWRRSQIPAGIREFSAAYVAVEAGVNLDLVDNIGLDDEHLVAAWLFFVEQLVAFRRHEILYTDIKCGNILARKVPFQVLIVDFDNYLILRDGVSLKNYGITPGFMAPEMLAGRKVSERSIVYQTGLLLTHLLDKSRGHAPDASAGVFRRVFATMATLRLDGLVPIIKSTLKKKASERPRDLEDFHDRLRGTVLPKKIKGLWLHLRKPYEARLAEVGLHP